MEVADDRERRLLQFIRSLPPPARDMMLGLMSSLAMQKEATMQLVKLYTRGGDYVATVQAPPFNPQAEAIGWGTRFFMRDGQGNYREGIVWFASDDHTVDPAEVTDEKDLT
jgi:hypothetical protein